MSKLLFLLMVGLSGQSCYASEGSPLLDDELIVHLDSGVFRRLESVQHYIPSKDRDTLTYRSSILSSNCSFSNSFKELLKDLELTRERLGSLKGDIGNASTQACSSDGEIRFMDRKNGLARFNTLCDKAATLKREYGQEFANSDGFSDEEDGFQEQEAFNQSVLCSLIAIAQECGFSQEVIPSPVNRYKKGTLLGHNMEDRFSMLCIGVHVTYVETDGEDSDDDK